MMGPGVKIVWATNPLKSRVELDDVGLQFLALRLKLEEGRRAYGWLENYRREHFPS